MVKYVKYIHTLYFCGRSDQPQAPQRYQLPPAQCRMETNRNKGSNMPCKGLISSTLLNSRQDDTRVCRAVSLALVSPSIWKDGTVQWTPVNTLGKTETVQRMIRSTCANCASWLKSQKKHLHLEIARWLSLWYTPIGRYQSCPWGIDWLQCRSCSCCHGVNIWQSHGSSSVFQTTMKTKCVF